MTSFFPQSLWDLVFAIATKVFSNQGDVTVRLMIQYGQFSNLSEILCKFRLHPIKTEGIMMLTSMFQL